MQLYHSNITKKIFQNCEKFWNNIMVEDMSWKKISWENYKNLALFYTEILKSKWIEKWDLVVVFIKNVINFSAYALAVLLVWAKLVIIEPDYSEKILEEKLKFIKPDLIIIEWFLYYLLKVPLLKNISKIKKYSSLIKYSKKIIVNNNLKNKTRLNYNKITLNNINKNTESLIVFTGWTTWKPKWVVHTLESLEIMFERISIIIWKDSKIFYADLPHFVLMWINMWVKIIVWENNISDKKFLNILKKHKIDTTFSPPYRYNNFLKEDIGLLPKTLKHILLGSAPIYKSFLEKLYKNIRKNTKITCIYWMTELLPISFIDWKEKLEKNIKWDLLWKILRWINIKVLESKELEVYGLGLFKKYLWWEIIKSHKTWDLVSFENWNLIMKWRKKDMILRKDYNVYPSLYEWIINSIPWVIESALIWIFDEKLQDEKIILYLEWKKLDKDFIYKKLKYWKFSIDKFALPDGIIFLEKIPRKWRQNKIDKNYLRKNYKKLWK